MNSQVQLRPDDIGLCATHRVMNSAMQLSSQLSTATE